MATTNELVHLIDRVLKDGVILQHEWDLLIELIHADGEIDEVEKGQLSKIYQLVKSGEIEVRNEESDPSKKQH
jgi:uncharacterized tellurite resistance protein B-like protein